MIEFRVHVMIRCVPCQIHVGASQCCVCWEGVSTHGFGLGSDDAVKPSEDPAKNYPSRASEGCSSPMDGELQSRDMRP